MRWYKKLSQVLLILPAIDFALAAPVVAQEREVRVSVVDAAIDETTWPANAPDRTNAPSIPRSSDSGHWREHNPRPRTDSNGSPEPSNPSSPYGESFSIWEAIDSPPSSSSTWESEYHVSFPANSPDLPSDIHPLPTSPSNPRPSTKRPRPEEPETWRCSLNTQDYHVPSSPNPCDDFPSDNHRLPISPSNPGPSTEPNPPLSAKRPRPEEPETWKSFLNTQVHIPSPPNLGDDLPSVDQPLPTSPSNPGPSTPNPPPSAKQPRPEESQTWRSFRNTQDSSPQNAGDDLPSDSHPLPTSPPNRGPSTELNPPPSVKRPRPEELQIWMSFLDRMFNGRFKDHVPSPPNLGDDLPSDNHRLPTSALNPGPSTERNPPPSAKQPRPEEPQTRAWRNFLDKMFKGKFKRRLPARRIPLTLGRE